MRVRDTEWQVSPSAGIFLINNLAAGLRLGYSKTMSITTYSGQRNARYGERELSFSPFVRWYLLPTRKPLNFFIDGSYVVTKNRITILDQKYEPFTTQGLSIFAGPAFFVSNSLALEATIGYKKMKHSKYGKESSGVFTSIGFQLHFGKKKE